MPPPVAQPGLKKQTPARRLKAAARKARELKIVGRALSSTRHPVMAQIVPMRFCNLSCAYCNEYDKVSKPVPLAEMVRRIDHLAELGTSIITISGWVSGSPPEMVMMLAPSAARWAIRRSISSNGTGLETLSYSLQ